MSWIIGIVLAGIFWALSAMPFIEVANHNQLLQQLNLNLRTVLVQMGALSFMFPVVNKYFLAPLREAMDERTRDLEHTYTEAEKLRADMGALKSDYEARLAAAEASAREQIQVQIREAQDLRKTLMAEASAKADELVVKAREEIEIEKHKVMSEVRLHVVNLTLGATERILGENVSNDTNRRLVQEFIDKVEVPG